jgi:hypothetical protein
MQKDDIEAKVQKLPEDLKKEVLDYIDFLLSRGHENARKRFRFDWEGGLSEIKESSVELQHRALEWR